MIDPDRLNATATAMVAAGKGLLAADESTSTIGRRFDAIGLASTEETRRDWRELLFGTREAMASYISGVILFDETIRQSAADGTPLVRMIEEAGSIPGIKVDRGAKPLALAEGESVTEGLDGLRERLAEYRGLGARFAKWRAVIDVGRAGDRRIPSALAIEANAHALARYAALCQDEGLVPIVEPEVLMDGDHDIDRCEEVTGETLGAVFAELCRHRVLLEGMVLKPNMVVPGKQRRTAPPEEIAEATIRCFRRFVPAAVPGIVFLSGGQDEVEATANLDAMNRSGEPLPWALSFSYGRALQQSALQAWGGRADRVDAGRRVFHHRARMNGLAQRGAWRTELESGEG